MKKVFLTVLGLVSILTGCSTQTDVVRNEVHEDYTQLVSPLMGTLSNFELSTGNTYPAIAMPWGMNFWTPRTNKIGDGWQYTYTANKIYGFEQTHQPSPWINDYGQFSIMPMANGLKINENDRASWFSHKAEKSTPYYYSVYLSEYDLTTEITPTERCAYFRFTFPETDEAFVVIDAFDHGSYVKIIPEENKVIGYTTRNSSGGYPDRHGGGIPEGFVNYFIVEFDKPFTYNKIWAGGTIIDGLSELKSEHSGAAIGFATKRGEQVHARVSSSFISWEQAERNMKEIGDKTFDQVKQAGRDTWNDVLGRITIESDDTEDVRVITLHSNLYNNLSNTYLYLKKITEAAEALKKAFEIRKKYEHLGLLESHDTLQQMANLANMLIIGNELAQARELLNLYESLISKYENEECLDYGFCQTMFGILCYREGKATEAERHLLSAETIIADVMGTDNDYMKTVYRYLYSLYTRWKKPELAQNYREKLIEINRNMPKIT